MPRTSSSSWTGVSGTPPQISSPGWRSADPTSSSLQYDGVPLPFAEDRSCVGWIPLQKRNLHRFLGFPCLAIFVVVDRGSGQVALGPGNCWPLLDHLHHVHRAVDPQSHCSPLH